MVIVFFTAFLLMFNCWASDAVYKNVILTNVSLQTSTLKATDTAANGKATFYSFPYTSLSFLYKRIDVLPDIKFVIGGGLSHHPITKTANVDIAGWNKILKKFTIGGDWLYENLAYSLYYQLADEIIPKAAGLSTISFPADLVHFIRPEVTWRPKFNEEVFLKGNIFYGLPKSSNGYNIKSVIGLGFELGKFWQKGNNLHGMTLKGQVKKTKTSITKQTYYSIGPSYLMSLPW